MVALCTEGEAATVVKGVASVDGILAYGLLHKRYSQRTLGRMFRLQNECMYPKMARDLGEVSGMVLEWDDRWRKMIVELGEDARNNRNAEKG